MEVEAEVVVVAVAVVVGEAEEEEEELMDERAGSRSCGGGDAGVAENAESEGAAEPERRAWLRTRISLMNICLAS